ncbi:MAG: hemolysin family protein [Candidatus Altiarchaeota archaeon]
MDYFMSLLVLVFLVAMSALFSAVELSLISVSQLRVRNLVKNKRWGAKTLKRLKDAPERMLITVLIGNNIVNILASALATYVAILYFGYLGVGLAVGVISFLILVFGEILPKTLATAHSEQIALFVARPIELMQKVMQPLILGFELVSSLMGRIIGKKMIPLVTEDMLKTMIEVGVEEKVWAKEERDFIEGVLRFDDVKVESVMTPFSKMFCLDGELTVAESLPVINTVRFSRFPVYAGGDCGNIIGSVHIKDILKAFGKDGRLKVKDLAKKTLYTPKSAILKAVFTEMLKRHQHIAIVGDGAGKVEGLVTLENLIEEITGEIRDEAEPVTPP